MILLKCNNIRSEKMRIPSELKELAQLFQSKGHTLYIVGGYVRDAYLNIQSLVRDDIDLCSDVTPKSLKELLNGTKFELQNLNEKLGVMAIFGKRRYEYATFRREVYEDEGHIPDKVEFIKSLEEDSKRRDFKINAIYYDILAGEYIDPTGGIEDLKNQVITTVRAPKIVFNDDPERILRLIRFACCMGLKIPEDELWYARKNSYKIQFISKFRLRNEFERLLTADEVYPELLYTKDAHFRAMMLLGEIKCWKYIMPTMYEIESTKCVDEKGERIYDHTLNCLKNASPSIRLAVLLHDAGKVKTMETQKNFFGASEFVGTIVDKNLGINGLGYSNNVVSKVTRIINGYDFNRFGFASRKTVKKFIFENRDVIENIIEIKTVIKNENKVNMRRVRSAEVLRHIWNEMQREKAPFTLKELAINGDEIIRNFPQIKVENIDDLLDELLLKTALNPMNNRRENLLLMANKLINSKRDYYLE